MPVLGPRTPFSVRLTEGFRKIRERGPAWLFKELFLRAVSVLLSILLRPLRVRYLPVLVERIGHLAFELDAYIKERQLGLRPHYWGLVCAPDKKVSNQRLAQYWRRYVTVLSSPNLCKIVSVLGKTKWGRYDVIQYGNTVNVTARYALIQQKWGTRPPLLELTDEDRTRGRKCLTTLGIPQGAWLVCFHSRSRGYATYDDDLHAYRNSDVMNYLAAARAIIDRGGWCIRMGDSAMRKLPVIEGLVDYAHSAVKSDWMDVFLCASCRFFLGSTSGLGGVSSVFGVPVALANLAPICMLPFGQADIGIPKLLWSVKCGRYLTFKEAFESPVSNYRFTHLYQEAGIRVDENSPEDIRDLALEMLESLEGRATYSEEDQRMQTTYKSFFKPGHYCLGVPARVGRDFLSKYRHLLTDESI